MQNEQLRPTPESLLEATQRAKRGRLRLFLGASPGVGKTYAMLKAAHDRQAEGVDVVIGMLETHGRKETEALVAGLPIIPRQSLIYKDRPFEEMDLDAILQRRAALVLVDELAHTNIEGSRHPKRYQDVLEILDSGIDVYSTLNIQHLESLNDTIRDITGVEVRETIPDAALKVVDEIALIDIPPAELKKRLSEGKVYVPDQAARAVNRFFSDGNLTALRELAFRFAARAVDAEMLSYLQVHGIDAPTPSFDRIMGLISGSEGTEQLVRLCAQMAELRHARWLVVHVETPDNKQAQREQRLSQAFQLAESLGGETLTVYGTNIALEILRLARARNITRIVVGRSRRPLWYRRLIQPSVATRLLTGGGQSEVLVAPLQTRQNAPSVDVSHQQQKAFPLLWSFIALGLTSMAVGLGFVFKDILPLHNLSFLFIAVAALSAYFGGLWPAMLSTITAVLAYNFFFTEPLYSLSVDNRNDVVTIAVFLVVSLLASNIALRLKRQVQAVQAYAQRTENLYALSRKLAAAMDANDVAVSVVEQVHVSLTIQTALFLPENETLNPVPTESLPQNSLLGTVDVGAAEWAFAKGEVAGHGSATLPASAWLFLPFKTKEGRVIGLLGVVPKSQATGIFDVDERRFLDAVCHHAALALERIDLTAHVAETKVYTESERLRAALLSSVSHDFRTPLASITGSAFRLLEYDEHLPKEERINLTQTILEESGRLNRFIENLLSMTKMGTGSLKPNFDWIDIQDLVNATIKRFELQLKKRTLSVNVPPNLSLLYGDFVLLEQVFVNVLGNAIEYSPKNGKIYFAVFEKDAEFIFDIQDTGPGLSPEIAEHAFDMFTRFQTGDRQDGGMGLGLSICRGIIEAHSGIIELLSNDKWPGLRVKITLPLNSGGKRKVLNS
jgi:two-component system sensor histidine kinase KdpD